MGPNQADAPSPQRAVVRVLLFLAVVLGAVYALAGLKHFCQQKGAELAYLPSLEVLPGFREPDTLANLAIEAERLALIDQIDSLALALEQEPNPSLPAEDTVEPPPVVPQIPEGVPLIRLEYGESGGALLHNLFTKLHGGLARRSQVRILHFGDSQIEGDRVTSYFRSRLQRDFGGTGVGMISPVPPVYPPYGLTVKPQAGWKIFAMMPAAQRQKEERYGVLGSVCRFAHRAVDELEQEMERGDLQLTRRLQAGRGMQFSRCRALVRTPESAMAISLLSRDSLVELRMLSADTVAQSGILDVPKELEEFTLRFETAVSQADVYAVSLESPTGVQVDNIPLRGSSGTDFTAMHPATIKGLFQQLKPSLLILQFGVNVVPGGLTEFGFYTKALTRQLNYLKGLLPGVPIILMGVSDMGEKRGEYFRSYENIPTVRNAQRKAAQQAGVVFWDTYTAMGGLNSIVAWVNADPPLATADYVHFTPRGARYLSEMFYAALMADYNHYVATLEASDQSEKAD